MKGRPLREGVIGCGFFAMNQLHAWHDVEGAEIVALSDRDPDRLSQALVEAAYASASEQGCTLDLGEFA